MKPTIYRITHLWPNKQPGQGSTTAEIEEEQETWEVERDRFGIMFSGPPLEIGECIKVGPADSSTVQIKAQTDEPNALPSRFVSLQDYEAQQRALREIARFQHDPYDDGEYSLSLVRDIAKDALETAQDYEALEREARS